MGEIIMTRGTLGKLEIQLPNLTGKKKESVFWKWS